jgi:hypothetical protein
LPSVRWLIVCEVNSFRCPAVFSFVLIHGGRS